MDGFRPEFPKLGDLVRFQVGTLHPLRPQSVDDVRTTSRAIHAVETSDVILLDVLELVDELGATFSTRSFVLLRWLNNDSNCHNFLSRVGSPTGRRHRSQKPSSAGSNPALRTSNNARHSQRAIRFPVDPRRAPSVFIDSKYHVVSIFELGEIFPVSG